jgi:predicted aspartyl protease
MRFHYQLDRSRQAVVSLGGRWVRPRPLITVSLVGPTSTYVNLALLDTGADDTIFPERVAHAIGIDLTGAPVGMAGGIGARVIPVRYAEVQLRLTDGRELREWTAWVGFTSIGLRWPLLGFAGCLQFFTATFLGDREEVELAVNSLYRGT